MGNALECIGGPRLKQKHQQQQQQQHHKVTAKQLTHLLRRAEHCSANKWHNELARAGFSKLRDVPVTEHELEFRQRRLKVKSVRRIWAKRDGKRLVQIIAYHSEDGQILWCICTW